MIINTEKLITITHFAELKGVSRQHIYRLSQANNLTIVEIDQVKFVLIDEKADNLVRKRKEKNKKE